MRFEVIDGPEGTTRVSLHGRLDIEGTRAIDERFSYATTVRAGKYIVDLSEVTFLATIGIRLLLTAARGQMQRGGKFALAAPQPLVRKVLEAAGVDRLVPLAPDVEAAEASFGG